MDTNKAGEATARFERPPVEQVALTVFFEAIEGLQVSHFSALRETWRDEYPDTAELPPLRPRNRDDDEETAVMPVSQAWPFPYLMFSTADDSGGVAIQNDRFTRTWNHFSPAEKQYPGFEILSADMETRFAEFTETVAREAGQQIKPTGAESYYRNQLPGWSAEDLFVGMTTQWQADFRPAPLNASYAGMRIHVCTEADMDNCAVTLSVDVDDGDSYLTIRSERDVSDDDGELRLGGIDLTHKQLIRKFVAFTSPKMHEEWGRSE